MYHECGNAMLILPWHMAKFAIINLEYVAPNLTVFFSWSGFLLSFYFYIYFSFYFYWNIYGVIALLAKAWFPRPFH